MTHRLFIAYKLKGLGRDSGSVRLAFQKMGAALCFGDRAAILRTVLNREEAYDVIRSHLAEGDRLTVMDWSGPLVTNVPPIGCKATHRIWYTP